MKQCSLHKMSQPLATSRLIRLLRMLSLALVALLSVVPFAGCSTQADDNAPIPTVAARNVTLPVVQRQNLKIYSVTSAKYRKTIEATGAVDFDNDQATNVLAPFSGPVSRLLVSPGDRVKKGGPLATVESADFATAVSAYRKALATARNARKVADTDKDLIEHNGVSQRDELQAQTDAVNAEADRDAALQALVALQVNPQVIKDIQDGRPVSRIEGMIRAPIAGTVVEKLITPGQLLQAGTTPCFTVADLSKVWVLAQIFGSNLTSVNVGDSAEVVTGVDTKIFTGTVSNIAGLVDPGTRAVAVRVVVDNPGAFLKKQMYVHVRIHASEESTGLLVPVSAILRDEENLAFVYVVQADNSFARQHVTLGYRTQDQFEIQDGLKAGDQIVVDGGIFVQFVQNQ